MKMFHFGFFTPKVKVALCITTGASVLSCQQSEVSAQKGNDDKSASTADQLINWGDNSVVKPIEVSVDVTQRRPGNVDPQEVIEHARKVGKYVKPLGWTANTVTAVKKTRESYQNNGSRAASGTAITEVSKIGVDAGAFLLALKLAIPTYGASVIGYFAGQSAIEEAVDVSADIILETIQKQPVKNQNASRKERAAMTQLLLTSILEKGKTEGFLPPPVQIMVPSLPSGIFSSDNRLPQGHAKLDQILKVVNEREKGPDLIEALDRVDVYSNAPISLRELNILGNDPHFRTFLYELPEYQEFEKRFLIEFPIRDPLRQRVGASIYKLTDFSLVPPHPEGNHAERDLKKREAFQSAMLDAINGNDELLAVARKLLDPGRIEECQLYWMTILDRPTKYEHTSPASNEELERLKEINQSPKDWGQGIDVKSGALKSSLDAKPDK